LLKLLYETDHVDMARATRSQFPKVLLLFDPALTWMAQRGIQPHEALYVGDHLLADLIDVLRNHNTCVV